MTTLTTHLRTLIKTACGLLLFLALLPLGLRAQSFVYVNQDNNPNAVTAFSVAANGALTQIGVFPTGGNGVGTGFYASNREAICVIGSRLYVANTASNNVSAFDINPVTGALTLVAGSPFATGGTSNGRMSLTCTPDGRFLIAANGISNNITVFLIGPTGALSPIAGSPFAAGGVNLDGIKVTPDGKFLTVALFDSDRIGVYSIAANGALTPVAGSPFASPATGNVAGLEINSASNLLFAAQAVAAGTKLDVFTIGPTGTLTAIAGSPFNLVAGVGNNSNVAVLSPNNQFLFVSNQESNQITVLSVAANGSLAPIAGSPFANPGGAEPQQMVTNPAGTQLFMNNLNGTVSVFTIAANGSLTPVPGSPFAAGSNLTPGIAFFTAPILFLAPNLTVQAGGRPNNLGIGLGDPAVCIDPGGLVGIEATVTNPNNAPLPASFSVTLPASLAPVAGTCMASTGNCAINGQNVSWNGTLNARQTVSIVYRARLTGGIAAGTPITLNNTATVGGVPANLAYTFRVDCPAIVNTRLSDQKAGSVLVFPYYTSTVGGASDTRLALSNISNSAPATLTRVHLFLIDGASCQQTDLYVCLTPNASFSFKASDYDPGVTGYVIAVAVDANGVPVQNNVLIGNAFVKTPQFVGNYGAESFWANNALALATIDGPTATLYFDHVGYDAAPKQFAVEIQSPSDVAGQFVVTAGLSGNLATSQVTGAAQVGVGQAYNQEEKFASFSNWLTGSCQARGTLSTNNPRVPNGLNNLIRTGMTGTLRFNVGAAVGLILTPQTAAWKGIRTLHKTQTVATTLTIPLLPPVC